MALLIIPVLNGDRELEVHTATYGPGIDQSQHAKSVSHIIMYFTLPSTLLYCFVLYHTLLLFTFIYFTFIYFTFIYFTLLYFLLLYFISLHYTLP